MKIEITKQPELVSLRETARMIRSCVRTVYRLIDDGELPRPIKIRARSFLPASAIRAFLVRQGLPESEGMPV
jgi:predicted DNA-binding transcriptional regulator AlpA